MASRKARKDRQEIFKLFLNKQTQLLNLNAPKTNRNQPKPKAAAEEEIAPSEDWIGEADLAVTNKLPVGEEVLQSLRLHQDDRAHFSSL